VRGQTQRVHRIDLLATEWVKWKPSDSSALNRWQDRPRNLPSITHEHGRCLHMSRAL
jgi:hypothetical protein